MPLTQGHLAELPKKEPVAFGGASLALINLAVAFGLDLSAEQIVALNTVLAPVVAFVVRRYVSPVR